MKDLYNKLMAIAYVIGMIFVPLIVMNGFFYFIGSFIAMDWNPSNWWLVKSAGGRFIFVILELGVISSIPKFWESFE